MSASDRPLLRLFVHCRERKFVQVARPSDSIGDLALDIQSKFAKLYAGAEIQATRLQCTNGFDLDGDDTVADVFQDRDHVYVDISGQNEPLSPVKRFRSPPSMTPKRTVNATSGGSPIQQKITPVTSLPNVQDPAQKLPSRKSDDDQTTSDNVALVNAVSPKPESARALNKKVPKRPDEPKADSGAPSKANDATESTPKLADAARPKRPSKSRKQAPAKSVLEPKQATAKPSEPVLPDPEAPATSSGEAASAPANEDQPKSKKHKKQKKGTTSEAPSTVKDRQPEPEPEKIADEAEEADSVHEAADDESEPKADGASQDEMATCKKCHETMTKKSLKAHHKLHYEFACQHCPKKYGSEKGLEGHVKRSH